MTQLPPRLDWTHKVGPLYQTVDPLSRRGLNIDFFNDTARGLHLVGFDHLADLAQVGSNSQDGSLTRLMLTLDGYTLAAIAQAPTPQRPQGLLNRFKQLVRPQYGACSLTLISRFANGMHFFTDIGDPGIDRNDPTGIHLMTLPRHTSPKDLARIHLERLRAYRGALPLVRPMAFEDWRDYQRMESLLAGRREKSS